jgi:hypothetical protein
MRIHLHCRYSIHRKRAVVRTVASFGPTQCWALGTDLLLHSSDAGRSWKNLFYSSHLPACTNPHQIAFYSMHYGLLLTKDSSVGYYLTKDGGLTWMQIRHLHEESYVWAEVYASSKMNKVWSVIKGHNENSFIEIMDTATLTWMRIPIRVLGIPMQIIFENTLRGWILERWNRGSWIEESPEVEQTTTVLHYTQDGGLSWTVIAITKCAGVKLHVLNSSKLLMVAEEGIFLSEDNGIAWRQIYGSYKIPLYDIDFKGIVGVAFGTDDLIESASDILFLSSKDGGETWTEAEIPVVNAFLGVRLITWSTGILVSEKKLYTFSLPNQQQQ